MKDIIVNQVYGTTDYDKFSFLTGNREINQGNIIRLKKSMEQKQLQTPIIVNEKFEIIDGQHRFYVIKDLGLPLFYMIVNGYDLEECQTLNNNNLNWKNLNFIKSYAEIGNQHYVKFLEFMDMFPGLGRIRTYTYILQGTLAVTASARGEVDKIKSGRFQIKDWNNAVETAQKLMGFKNCANVFGSAIFIEAILKIIRCPKYDHERMMTKLSYQQTKLVRCTSYKEYYALVSEIYNYRTSEKDKVYFEYELSKTAET